MNRHVVLGALFATAAVAQHVLHMRFEQTVSASGRERLEALPSPEALLWMSVGHRNVVADYYWLRTLEHFGDAGNHAAAYPLSEPLITRVLALDPYFKEAYTFAGTALTLNPATVGRSDALLEQGLEYRPDYWQIPYYLGFNLFYFEHDYGRAAEVLAQAARLPGVPAIAAQLATRVASEADRPEVGLNLVDDMLERTTDLQLKEAYGERRKALLMELQVGELSKDVATFTRGAGHLPADIDELAAALKLPRPLLDPYGAGYVLHSDGSVHSANDDKRLRIYRDSP